MAAPGRHGPGDSHRTCRSRHRRRSPRHRHRRVRRAVRPSRVRTGARRPCPPRRPAPPHTVLQIALEDEVDGNLEADRDRQQALLGGQHDLVALGPGHVDDRGGVPAGAAELAADLEPHALEGRQIGIGQQGAGARSVRRGDRADDPATDRDVQVQQRARIDPVQCRRDDGRVAVPGLEIRWCIRRQGWAGEVGLAGDRSSARSGQDHHQQHRRHDESPHAADGSQRRRVGGAVPENYRSWSARTQAAWKPTGTRWGSSTRATGPAAMSAASRISTSLRPSRASVTKLTR